MHKPPRATRRATAKAPAANPCLAPAVKRAPSRTAPARKAPVSPAPVPTAPETSADAREIPSTQPASRQPQRLANLPVPASLRGSHDSLVRQNSKTESEGLERIEDEDDLHDRIARKMLVPVPASAKLVVSESLPSDLRYCRPWTAQFLTDLAGAHAAAYRHPLTVSSAVRTVEYQKRLMLRNGNAAAAEGDIVSPHLTGATVDISKQFMNRQELNWLRRWLLAQQTAGKIDVEEEFRQTCFHITVYKSYAPAKLVRTAPAPSRAGKRVKPSPVTPDVIPEAAQQGLVSQGS